MSDIRKLLNIINESTTSSGSVASMATPMTTERRSNEYADENTSHAKAADIKVLEYGNWENSTRSTSKKLKQTRTKAKTVKKKYDEDITVESIDGVSASTKMFAEIAKKNPVAKAAQRVVKGSGKHKNPAKTIPRKSKHKGRINEDEITEHDLILSPTLRKIRDRELLSRSVGTTDHEVEMARNDLTQAAKNSVQIMEMIRDISEEQGLEGWVQEKITKASDYLNSVREYLEGKYSQPKYHSMRESKRTKRDHDE